MPPGNSNRKRSPAAAAAKSATASFNRLKPPSTHQRDAAVNGTENPSGSRTNNHLNMDSMFEIRLMSSPGLIREPVPPRLAAESGMDQPPMIPTGKDILAAHAPRAVAKAI